MRKLNVGLIGAGFMGKAHSLAYAGMPMFFWPAPALPHRHTVADVTEELARDAASRFGFESATNEWRKIVDDPVIDVIDIATPNDTHAEIAIAAAHAGKHVICEKPLARTLEEAQEMYDAVLAAGVVNMVAFNYRRTPAVVLAREIVAEGEIGRILNFRGTYMSDWSADPNVPRSWRLQKAVAGSGALGDIGSHVLDIARYIVGEVTSVNAVAQTYIADRPEQTDGADKLGSAEKISAGPRVPVDVDDEVIAVLRFADGAVGSLEASRNAYGRNNFLTFEIHGETGTIAFNYERSDELRVFFASDPPDRRGFRTIYTGPAHPYGEMLWPIPGLGTGYAETKIIECHDLFKAIVEGTTVRPNFGDGLQVARISEAILESARDGVWVQVEPIVTGSSDP
jgi:predicted dehydrogenase